MASLFRRARAHIAKFLASVADPALDATVIQLYGKDVAGVIQLFAEASDGTINQLTPISQFSNQQPYGSGVDGALNFDGVSNVNLFGGTSLVPAANVYTLTRSLYATSITIAAGVTVLPVGFHIYCQGNTLLNGDIDCNGGNGNNGTLVAAGTGGTAAIGTSRMYGVTPAGANGGAGGNGSTGATPAGLAPLGIAAATAVSGNNGGTLSGGSGGTGNNGGVTNGGADRGGGYAYAPASSHGWNSADEALWGRSLPTNGASPNVLGSATSGGGGGGNGSAGGGGGGAAGGTIGLFSRTISGSGRIRARGGNGGNGGPMAGGTAGGGAGGGGGIVNVISSSDYPFDSVTVDVSGGTGGLGGSGPAGPGGDGGDGGTGIIRVYKA